MNPTLEKIKKLLRLGRDKGATAAEAASALAKAQQIATAAGISLTDISDDQEKSSGLTHITTVSQKGLPQRLASGLIQRHFGVSALFMSGMGKTVIYIVGTPSQAQIATYVYVYLVRTLRASWRDRANKRLRDRESYLRGFCHAIANTLPAVFPQTELMLSQEAYMTDHLVPTRCRMIKPPAAKSKLSDAAAKAGYKAGKAAGIRNAIRGSSTLNLD